MWIIQTNGDWVNIRIQNVLGLVPAHDLLRWTARLSSWFMFHDTGRTKQAGLNYLKQIGAVEPISICSSLDTNSPITLNRFPQFPTNSSADSIDADQMQTLQKNASGYLVKIKVTEFKVWEQPLNHINLRATVLSKTYRVNKQDEAAFVYEAQCLATNQSIGTTMSTSSGFIKEMNKISDNFADNLSKEILENLQTEIITNSAGQ